MAVGEGLEIGVVVIVAAAVKVGTVEGVSSAGSLFTLDTPKATPMDMPITSMSDIARIKNFSEILVFIYLRKTLKFFSII